MVFRWCFKIAESFISASCPVSGRRWDVKRSYGPSRGAGRLATQVPVLFLKIVILKRYRFFLSIHTQIIEDSVRFFEHCLSDSIGPLMFFTFAKGKYVTRPPQGRVKGTNSSHEEPLTASYGDSRNRLHRMAMLISAGRDFTSRPAEMKEMMIRRRPAGD